MKTIHRTEFFLKIAAFVIAVLLWLNISFSRKYEMIKNVPIIVDSLKETMMFNQPIGKELKIKISGTGKDLFSELFKDNYYYLFKIDKNELYKKQTHNFVLDNVIGFSPSNGLTAEIINGKSVEFYLTKRVTKKVPVRSNVTIETEKNYVLWKDIKIEPSEVSVVGPDVMVNKINEIFTDTIKLLEISKDIEIDVNLISFSDDKNVAIHPSKVAIKAEVSEIHTVDFRKIPVELKFTKRAEPKKGEKIILGNSYCDVTFSGPDRYLDSLKKEDINAFLSINKPVDKKNNYRVNVRLDLLHDKIKVVQIQPESIFVNIEKK